MIEGLDGLMGTLEQMVDKIDKQTKQNVEDAIELVKTSAKMMCPVGFGELRQSIHATVHEQTGGIQGVCTTNKDYAVYVELGTGPKGEASHDGISPDVHPVYTQEPWWIPESQIDPVIVKRYHFVSIDTDEGKFYLCSGQRAQPFMYPALKDNKENIIDIFKESLKIGK